MFDQNYQDTAHLLRRAGFGASADTIQQQSQRGLAAVTDDLLNPERTPINMDDGDILTRLTALLPEERRTDLKGDEYVPVQMVKLWWTNRMIQSPHPLVEKMVLFWHGHFTSKLGGRDGADMYRQNQLYRYNALGNFRTLALAVSQDPAMLKFLNGNQNFKAHPNENYGRELMELFTCGIGNYTEDDVKAAARAFSGWNLRGDQFYFNARQHDNSEKTFMGRTGNWNGDDIIEILVKHPATARRLCTQLFSFFAYTDPEPPVVDALVKTYYDSGYDVRAILTTIFQSHAFYSDKARYALIKSPVQYVVGTVKMLGMDQALRLDADDISPQNDAAVGQPPDMTNQAARVRGLRVAGLQALVTSMRNMGQDIFDPPSVKGWDGNEAWINTSTLLSRVEFANQISLSRVAFDGKFARAVDYVQESGFTPATWVDYLAGIMGPLPLNPDVRQAMIDYVNGADGSDNNTPAMAQNTADVTTPGTGQQRGQRFRQQQLLRQGPLYQGMEGLLRGVIPLMMATPEYQVC